MLTLVERAMHGPFVIDDADGRRDVLNTVQRLAKDLEVEAYVVGGPVRDQLLGIPYNDLDITVAGSALPLAERLATAVGGRLTVHQRFGTATVSMPDFAIDLVTARSESYYHPGALPQVRVGTVADDLARRDFTINAMAASITDESLALVDPHGGRADLEAGLVRTLHPLSFVDDPTRIFRAIRYEQRFSFRIEDQTLNELRHAVEHGALATLTGDRIRHELERIFNEASPLPALRRAGELGALSAVHPALGHAHLEGLGDWSATPLSWAAALVWPLSAEQGASLATRLNAPADLVRTLEDTALLKSRQPQLAEAGLLPSGVCAQVDGLSPDALAAATRLAESVVGERVERYLSEWWSVAPLLRGTDLLELGVPSGPAVGDALRALRQARLDGLTRDRHDEEQLARQWADVKN
jgi:tRNA nucleotidyltransferase (CCA-adding enzyme)